MEWPELTDFLATFDGKWDLGILANLEAGPMRPAELCRVINDEVRGTGHVLDPGVLASTLKRLIDDGLVEHRDVASFPRTALYSLTPDAYDLVAVLNGVDAWYAARRRYWQQRTDAIMHRRVPMLRRFARRQGA